MLTKIKRKSKSNKKKSYKKSRGGFISLGSLMTFTVLPAFGSIGIQQVFDKFSGKDIEEAQKVQLSEDSIKKGNELINAIDKNNKDHYHTQRLMKQQNYALSTGAILFLAYKIYNKFKHKKSPRKSPKIVDYQKSTISEQIKKLLDSKIFLFIVAALLFYFKKK